MTGSFESDKESKLDARLKELLNDISEGIETAPREVKQRLLTMLQDLRTKNTRKYTRKPVSIEVAYTVQDQLYKNFVKNISAGGVFIDTPAAFAAGEKITLTFSPPDQEEPIKIDGQIVWNSPGGLGVKFSEPLNNDIEKIIKTS